MVIYDVNKYKGIVMRPQYAVFVDTENRTYVGWRRYDKFGDDIPDKVMDELNEIESAIQEWKQNRTMNASTYVCLDTEDGPIDIEIDKIVAVRIARADTQ